MPPGLAMVVVDAGYLIKALVVDARRRSREQLELDWPALTAMIADRTRTETGSPLLRQTWYDASWFAQPRLEHRELSALPGVHVRLGWLVRTDHGLAQKAVDSQIVRDLVVAAFEQAVGHVVIIAGDGDLVPGVHELVDRGITVHIWDVGSGDSHVRQSQELQALADRRLSLDPAELAAFVRVRPNDDPDPPAAAPIVPGPEGEPTDPSRPPLDPRLGPPSLRQLDPHGLLRLLPEVEPGTDAATFGRLYGRHWAERAGRELLQNFAEVARRPGLPRLIDHDLLRSARDHDLALDEEGVRHQLRDGFWRAVDEVVSAEPVS